MKWPSAVGAALLLVLAACGQGGRDPAAAASRQAPVTNPPGGSAPPAHTPILLDPVAEQLQPFGLGYRVDTILGHGEQAVHQTAYGVDGFWVGVDVDGDPGTGDVLGADISVHFLSLLLYARLQVDRLPGAPAELPLSVEVSVLDPRNLLGLPGLVGAMNPDLRVALGMDARGSEMPERFGAELSVLDSLVEFIPRFTSAQLAVSSSDAVADLSATLSLYSDVDERRHDGLVLRSRYQPAVPEAEINVVLTPDAEESTLTLTVAQPSAHTVTVNGYDGPEDARIGERDIAVEMTRLDGSLDLLLSGVDGLDAIDGRDSTYRLLSEQPIDTLRIQVTDRDGSGATRRSEAHIRPLPPEVEIVRRHDGGLQVESSSAIDDIHFAQAQNTKLGWAAEDAPGSPFTQHLLLISAFEDGGDLIRARLGGLTRLDARPEPNLSIQATLAAAPLRYRNEEPGEFTEARLAQLPAEFSLSLPEEDELLRFAWTASERGPSLDYEQQTPARSTIARLAPVPRSFSFCTADDNRCAHNGDSTDASIHIEASEHMLVNYQQLRHDDSRELQVNDVWVKNLTVDGGSQKGFRKGYLYFDTRGEDFSGEILQRSGSGGVYLLFSPGTAAHGRRVRWKNYVQIDERVGSMHCPGRSKLDIRSGGRWYDAGFVLDQLCQ